jgi:hypothetical protein
MTAPVARLSLVFSGAAALPCAGTSPVTVAPRLALALLSSTRCAATALGFAIALSLTGAARAQGDSYKQHMENGVKLYADRNYPAAVVEFQAAYEARPSANPLLNIALCDKEMFHYPQAIAALEAALQKHGAGLDAADKKAAEDAIKDMRGLLGTVTVTLTPRDATLLIDGEEQPAGMAGKPILLGPGEHKLVARAEGYRSAEQSITVASRRDQALPIALVAEKGRVTIEAPDAHTTISIDDQPVGTGIWSGMLAEGPHIVRMDGPDGRPYATQIQVIAGEPLDVRKGAGGVPLALPKVDPPSPLRGMYVLGLATILFPTTHVTGWPSARTDYGAGYGLRVGFQVNRIAGFDAMYEHSSIDTLTDLDPTAYYRIVANRVALGLRLISPGGLVRFVGAFGGGFVANTISFDTGVNTLVNTKCASVTTQCPFSPGSGVDAFATAEAALEVDLDHVLLDFGFLSEFQSTGNLTTGPIPSSTPPGSSFSLFGSKPLVNIGPALRFGYRFW